MTDCNDNQLVVKVLIEHDRAAAQDQQMATADQPTAQQTAPAVPRVEQTPEPGTATTAPGLSLAGTVPDVSHEVTIGTNESDNPTPIDLEPQTLGAGATLSDIDRIGLGTRVIRTTRASETIREGEQASTSEAADSQPASTSQDHQDLFGDIDLSGVDILDINVEGAEGFSDIDPVLADRLLGDSPEEMIKNWVVGCNRGTTAENELRNLEAVNEAVGHATPSTDCTQVAPASPVSAEERAHEETEEGSSTTKAQPGLTLRKHTIRIEKVGEFQRKDGQPLFLNAYPPVTRPTGLKVDDPDQAYRGQDLVDPSTIRPRHTRRERLGRQEEDRKKQQGGKALPTSVASAETTERMWYSGGRVIEARAQPWLQHLDGKSDHSTLIMCDQYVTKAARQEPAFGRPGQTLALLTPDYLTIVTPGDDTVLPAKQAIETSAALPYARGRQQEPIGERVIVNDLYGIPLYKPAVGPIDPNLGTGAVTAKRIIDSTGADPSFVSDEVVQGSSTGTYPLMYQDDDSGPMRYTCRMDDCCAVGGVRLAFSTEEELVADWNTSHVAVAPQFTCQVPGCRLTFAADPCALDRYLAHIGQKMTEEKGGRRPLRELHSLDGALSGALSVKPNPFFKPPSSVHGVP